MHHLHKDRPVSRQIICMTVVSFVRVEGAAARPLLLHVTPCLASGPQTQS